LSSINSHDRKELKRMCRQLERGQNILLKEARRLRGFKSTNPKTEEARDKLVEKLEIAAGRMMFVQEETEQLLKDIPEQVKQKKRRRIHGPAITRSFTRPDK
jgi:transcriptional regulator NrdR family protein